MNHIGGFLVLPGNLCTDGHMAALDLMVNGFTDIVEQTGPLCGGYVHTQLGGNQTGNMADLNGVVQHVLAVAGTVLHTAQQLDDFGVQTVNVRFKSCPLAFCLNGGIDFLLCFGNHFFDVRRVDTSIGNQFFQCNAGHFPTHRVKAGDCNGLRRIVDNQIAAGQIFERPDIPALAADDAAFHFVVCQRHDGNRNFTGMVRSTALDRGGDDLARNGVGLVLSTVFNFLDLHGHFVGHFGFHLRNQHILGLFHSVTGNALQGFHLVLFQTFNFCLGCLGICQFLPQGFIAFVQRIVLTVQVFLFLLQASFLLGQFSTAFLNFLLVLRPFFVYFFLCLKQCLALFSLRTFDCIIDNLGCFRFRLGNGLAVFAHTALIAHKNAHHRKNNCGNHGTHDDFQHCK